jgi:hypothetical protein
LFSFRIAIFPGQPMARESGVHDLADAAVSETGSTADVR